jgi:hypothetical protein
MTTIIINCRITSEVTASGDPKAVDVYEYIFTFTSNIKVIIFLFISANAKADLSVIP